LKILQISKYYHPYLGGIENHVHTLSTELTKQNNDVTVIASSKNRKFELNKMNGVKIIKFPKFFEIFNAPVSPDLLFKSNLDYDIVHIHLPNPFTSLLVLFKKTKNLIVTYHSDIIKFGFLKKILNFLYTKLILTKILKRAKKIIVTTPNYVEGSPIIKKFKKKIVTVPLGIDISSFKLNVKKNQKFHKLKKKHLGKKILLFVGRLVPYKGLPYLIYAMKKVTQKFPEIKLFIIGEGPQRENLKSLVNFLDISDNIQFLGEVSSQDLPIYYNLCDIFILPSTYKAEAFGIVQLEAMACQKPVISTNIPGSGVSFVNTSNETGIIVKPKDVKELVDAIIYLLKNEDVRKKLGKNAFKKVKNTFNKDIMTKNILDVYGLVDRLWKIKK